jgi:superfamily II DNA/RNA helicase
MKVVTDGVEIIIATPGRLNDLVEAGCIQIESVTYLVLDEVILSRHYFFDQVQRTNKVRIIKVMTAGLYSQGIRIKCCKF